MLRFVLRPQQNHADRLVMQALVARGLPANVDPATLAVVQQRGSYAGRRVTYLRVFDPTRDAERRGADRSAHTDDQATVFPARTP